MQLCSGDQRTIPYQLAAQRDVVVVKDGECQRCFPAVPHQPSRLIPAQCLPATYLEPMLPAVLHKCFMLLIANAAYDLSTQHSGRPVHYGVAGVPQRSGGLSCQHGSTQSMGVAKPSLQLAMQQQPRANGTCAHKQTTTKANSIVEKAIPHCMLFQQLGLWRTFMVQIALIIASVPRSMARS